MRQYSFTVARFFLSRSLVCSHGPMLLCVFLFFLRVVQTVRRQSSQNRKSKNAVARQQNKWVLCKVASCVFFFHCLHIYNIFQLIHVEALDNFMCYIACRIGAIIHLIDTHQVPK